MRVNGTVTMYKQDIEINPTDVVMELIQTYLHSIKIKSGRFPEVDINHNKHWFVDNRYETKVLRKATDEEVQMLAFFRKLLDLSRSTK